MKQAANKQIALPSLRGVMGDWVFYSCLMDIEEISERVRYAEEVHTNKSLSDLIQRQLKRGRSDQIATYLRTQEERFFNSLVIATYGGQPSWHGLSDVRSRATKADLKNVSDETVESLGFLTLRGDEKLFAIDGQHRLAGIKKVVNAGLDQDPYDKLSVIFVAHQTTPKGLERTRRLFTTLNKTARPVSKGDIVALDEDDAMAICVRWLIERTKLFAGRHRIAFVASNNMPVSNLTALTTIVSLYDLLTIVFTKTHFDLRKPKPELQRARPSDEELEGYVEYATTFFNLLKKYFPELGEFFGSKDTTTVVSKYRGSHGGSALFRPIGLDVFVQIIAKLNNDHTLTEAIKLAAKLPSKLSEPPFAGLMWNTSTKTIVNAHRVTLREVLLYMVGNSRFSDENLVERYRKDTGDENAVLPDRVV